MTITLLLLSNGHYSLEFQPSDMVSVAAAIRDLYGEPEKRYYSASVDYRFGGCHFTFQNEWDDPCLISASTEGDEILTALHRALAGS